MALKTTELPTTWGQDELSGGNFVLLGFAEYSLHLVAPPGARFKLDESDEERADWRHAVWQVKSDEDTPVVSIDAPDVVVGLRTSEVVELLPIDYHDFIRAQMARQLCRAISFGKPISGGCPDDEAAQVAGRTLNWVNQELADAFPAEGWFRQERPSVQMPNTIEEFLERFSDGRSSTHEESPRFAARSTLLTLGSSRRSASVHAILIFGMMMGSLTHAWRTLAVRIERTPDRH
jgi:hypothetical protein